MTSGRCAVLGAGLMGRLMAVSLAREGFRVELYDRSGPDAGESAAYVAAAMLSPLAESVDAEPLVVRLGRASLERWPELLSNLPLPVFFQRKGTLVLWHIQDRDQAIQFGRRLHQHDELFGKEERPRELSGSEIEQYEPALARRFSKAIYLPEEGQLDNRALLRSLGSALLECGVHTHWQTEVSPDQISADWIIDCRGLGARPDWNTLRGVRGEVIRVHAPDVGLSRPIRLLHPRYPIYIAPKPDGVYVIGATQIETDDTSPVSARSALELLSALYTVHPAFGEARVLEMASQCRPALPDNLPVIRWNGDRVIQINGLYRHGYLVAPALLDAALELIRHAAGSATDFDAWRSSQAGSAIFSLGESGCSS